jgi:NAD(P)-dependent dehydrogenase (short-subunit alcohol dehydrogenase family)
MKRLEGKVALITGGASGIGEAVARSFSAEGARVVIADIDAPRGRSLAGEIGAKAAFHTLDVREEGEWISCATFVLAEYGKLNILVNSAGITGFETGAAIHDPEHTTLSDWQAVHRTNLDGVFLGCKHGIRAMRQAEGGSIINISSRSGVVGVPAAAAYASSKAAVRNHTKTVALYCAEQGLNIRCNSIHPANILTPMWNPVLGSGPERAGRMQAVVQGVPSGRFGKPEEVAAVALLLASDEACYINGSELAIDGGVMAGSGAAPRIVS